MPITLGTIADELSPLVKRGYAEGAKEYQEISNQFVNEESSDEYYWRELEAGGIGYLQSVPEMTDVPTVDFNYGSTKQYEAAGYGLSIVIGRRTWQYKRLNIVDQASKMLGLAVKKTKDFVCTDLLDAGFATHTTPDGQFVFATAHTNLYAGTYSNTPAAAAALSLTALNDAYYLMATTLRHDVAPGGNQPKYLMIHPKKASVAHAIIKSDKVPGSNNNDSNFLFGRLNIIENNMLANQNYWYLLTEKQYQRVKFVWFMKPKLSRWVQDSNKSIHFDILADYDYGVTSGLGIYGVNAAA